MSSHLRMHVTPLISSGAAGGLFVIMRTGCMVVKVREFLCGLQVVSSVSGATG